MSITFISRDYGVNVSLVRVTSSDNLATCSAPGYLSAQVANLVVVNNGGFQWLSSDSVLVQASDGFRLFGISADLSSLVALSGDYTVSVPLTAAQWNGMYAAPVLLLNAPGANRLIYVNRLILAMKFVSAQYASGGAVAAQYESTVDGAGVAATATLAAATVNGLTASTVEVVAGASSIVYAAAVNQPLYLSNATGAFTTGDSTWVATVNYSVIATA